MPKAKQAIILEEEAKEETEEIAPEEETEETE